MKAKTGLLSSTQQTLSKHLSYANEISALKKLKVSWKGHVWHIHSHMEVMISVPMGSESAKEEMIPSERSGKTSWQRGCLNEALQGEQPVLTGGDGRGQG